MGSADFPAVGSQLAHSNERPLDEDARLVDALDLLIAVRRRQDEQIALAACVVLADFILQFLAVAVEQPDHINTLAKRPLTGQILNSVRRTQSRY